MMHSTQVFNRLRRRDCLGELEAALAWEAVLLLGIFAYGVTRAECAWRL